MSHMNGTERSHRAAFGLARHSGYGYRKDHSVHLPPQSESTKNPYCGLNGCWNLRDLSKKRSLCNQHLKEALDNLAEDEKKQRE